jgi:hypothetical protein
MAEPLSRDEERVLIGRFQASKGEDQAALDQLVQAHLRRIQKFAESRERTWGLAKGETFAAAYQGFCDAVAKFKLDERNNRLWTYASHIPGPMYEAIRRQLYPVWREAEHPVPLEPKGDEKHSASPGPEQQLIKQDFLREMLRLGTQIAIRLQGDEEGIKWGMVFRLKELEEYEWPEVVEHLKKLPAARAPQEASVWESYLALDMIPHVWTEGSQHLKPDLTEEEKTEMKRAANTLAQWYGRLWKRVVPELKHLMDPAQRK